MVQLEQGNDANSPKARVIIELNEDNRLVMETYTNGQRSRITLNRGTEFWEIVDELHIQRKRMESAAERKALKAEEHSRKLHRKVWIRTAEDHGPGFANRVIKGEVPIGYGKYLEAPQDAKAKKEPKAGSTLEDMLKLL